MKREPVVTAFVLATVALAAALGIDVSGWQDRAIDIGSGLFVIYAAFKARSKVTPTDA